MREKTKHSTNFITVLVRKINRNIRYHSRNTKGQLFTRGITQTTVSRSLAPSLFKTSLRAAGHAFLRQQEDLRRVRVSGRGVVEV